MNGRLAFYMVLPLKMTQNLQLIQNAATQAVIGMLVATYKVLYG